MNKKEGSVLFIVESVLSILLGFFIAYLIQFKFNFLGMTLVGSSDIIGLWIGSPIITFFTCFILISLIESKIKKLREKN